MEIRKHLHRNTEIESVISDKVLKIIQKDFPEINIINMCR